MLFPFLICSTAFALAAARLTRSPDAPALVGRADVTLADGTSMQYGTLAPEGLEWQSSGVLIKGGCSSTIQFITDCYELELGDDPSQELDPGYATARQRIEFLTPHQDDGTSWKYTWRSYYQSYDTGSNSFFHIMQIVSDTGGGPAVFLDILASGIALKDVTTSTVIATATVASLLATPLQHTLSVTYGPSGKLDYTITNSQTAASILKVSKTGAFGAGENYLKFGMYRAVYTGMPGLKSWYGDYTAEQT